MFAALLAIADLTLASPAFAEGKILGTAVFDRVRPPVYLHIPKPGSWKGAEKELFQVCHAAGVEKQINHKLQYTCRQNNKIVATYQLTGKRLGYATHFTSPELPFVIDQEISRIREQRFAEIWVQPRLRHGTRRKLETKHLRRRPTESDRDMLNDLLNTLVTAPTLQEMKKGIAQHVRADSARAGLTQVLNATEPVEINGYSVISPNRLTGFWRLGEAWGIFSIRSPTRQTWVMKTNAAL